MAIFQMESFQMNSLVVVKPTVANPETEQEAKGRNLFHCRNKQHSLLYSTSKNNEEYQEIDTPLGWLVDTDSAAPMAAAKTAATTTACIHTACSNGMQPRMPMMDPGGRVPALTRAHCHRMRGTRTQRAHLRQSNYGLRAKLAKTS